MKQRVILITGGSGKFGRLLVRHFLAAGDIVIATSRNDTSLDEMKTAYATSGERFIGLRCDLMEEGSAASFAASLEQQGIHPDCLINNARSLEFLRLEEDGSVSRSHFASELMLDVIAPYELTMALVNVADSHLRRVVNIGSQYGSVAPNLALYDDPARQSPIHYGVAKAALAHLTKELAVRLAPQGVLVNCIAFGGVEGRVDDAFKERYARLCPLGRMLTEDEVTGPVDMLLSDRCSAMTGHVLAVDGGWTVW